MSETTAKLMKKKPMMKGGKGKMRHMMMEPAENGVVSTMMHEPAEKDSDGPYQPPMETKTVHPTMAHLVKHVKANMAGAFPAAASADEPAGDPGDAE